MLLLTNFLEINFNVPNPWANIDFPSFSLVLKKIGLYLQSISHDLNIKSEELFIILILSILILILLREIILLRQFTREQIQTMLDIKDSIFKDKKIDKKDPRYILYFKLAYQYANNYVSEHKRSVYDSSWKKAALTSSERWRVYRVFRDLGDEELRKRGYLMSSGRTLKNLDNSFSRSSPKIISTLWIKESFTSK